MIQAWDFVDARVLWQRSPGYVPPDVRFLDTLIDDVEWIIDGDRRFTVAERIRNACKYHTQFYGNDPLVTVADLVAHSRTELTRIHNLGKLSLDCIEQVLANHGLQLREHRWPDEHTQSTAATAGL